MAVALRRRRPRARLVIAAIVFGLIVLLFSSARFYTDVLWFQEVGFESVLWKGLAVRAVLGLVVGAVLAGLVWVNLWLAARLASPYTILRLDEGRSDDPLVQYRETLGPWMRWIRVGIALFVGLVGGVAASSSWTTFLLWMNRVSFGTDDPQFGQDVGFYVFEYPFYDLVLGWIWGGLLAALVFAAGAHYFYGSIRPQRGASAITSGALAHLSALLAALALVKAAQYWLGRYGLNFSARGTVTGASYTDVNAQLPALTALMVIAIIAAVLFLVNIKLRRISLPLAAVGLWILVSILAGALWPLWIQRFSVEPQELQRERPFIARNIEATREAFGLSDVREEFLAASTDLTAEEITSNDVLLQNVRLWDPDVLQTAYSQLQAIRLYYEFHDVDIDRYEIDGQLRQVLLSPRELSLDGLPEGSRTWPNLHLGYTHGFGIVASLANEATTAGQPRFLAKDVPGDVVEGAESLALDEQPRIYYGESFESTDYSVVDSGQAEIDYPSGEDDQEVTRFRYDGTGGVAMGNFFKRLAFAVRESDPNLVLSSLITGDSQILLYRNVRDRVLRAAPFLSLDHDPYAAVIDGRLVWIVDAYTSTPWYPYSQRFDLGELVDAAEPGVLSDSANYVRNSVKVVVDAYNGTMNFYIVDDSDPLIEAWANAFPELFTDQEPSDDLRAHFRYPEDLFKVQSEVYLSYHMTDPENFYQKEDEWSVALNPLLEGQLESLEVPPTYLLFKLPSGTDQEFMLTRPFTPRAKNNMNAILVARSDPENYGELVTLQLPRQEFVAGPKQVNNLINQDVEISQTRTLLSREGSEVIFGSLVILPVEDSVLYIQPFFVKASDIGIPELKRVIMVFGERVVMRNNFDEALAALFDLETPEEQPPEEAPDEQSTGPPEQVPPRLAELLEEASDLYERAQEALSQGDFQRYGRLIEQLGEVLSEAQQTRQGSPRGR